jgi:maleylpyruvate isomerase
VNARVTSATEGATLRQRIAWMRAGTQRLQVVASRLEGAPPEGPSLLVGWTRGHVLAHAAQNALGLNNLLTWARTGVPSPMYSSADARLQAIEVARHQPMDVLLRELISSGEVLDEAITSLPAESWAATVTSALGRSIPAAEVPWIRVREVWVHAVDLDAGTDFADMPGDVGEALLQDVGQVVGSKMTSAGVLLEATDSDLRVALGPAPESCRVAGRIADLVGWLTGRYASAHLSVQGRSASDGLPDLPGWM